MNNKTKLIYYNLSYLNPNAHQKEKGHAVVLTLVVEPDGVTEIFVQTGWHGSINLQLTPSFISKCFFMGTCNTSLDRSPFPRKEFLANLSN